MACSVRASASTKYQGTSPAPPLSFTAALGDRLMLFSGAWNSSAGLLSGSTFNSIGMTNVGGKTDINSGIIGASFWYLDNPTVGTFNEVVSAASSFSALGYCVAAIAGADMTQAPIIGTGSAANNTAGACTVSGGGANDIYLGCFMTENPTVSGPGGAQVNIQTQTALNTNGALSADYILGSSAGNFSWTITSNIWAAIGCLVKGITPGAGPAARCIYVMP